ncbi:MAG: hypothetical protein NTY38_18545 [Acidobacteria bacterium]|nr:hypothetical protein [Acidobacteriota bacterium]
MKIALSVACTVFLLCTVLAQDMKQKAYELRPVNIGSTKQFFFDNRIIEDLWGVTRTVHPLAKHPGNPLLKATEPWEQGPGLGSSQVLGDPVTGGYRMWYLTFVPRGPEIPDEKRKPFERGVPFTNLRLHTAYATSGDGVRWEKPKVRLVEFNGSLENNMVPAPGPGTLAGSLPDQPSERRYLMAYLGRTQGREGVSFAYSPDGLRWTPAKFNPVLEFHNDTGISLFRDRQEGKWHITCRPRVFTGLGSRRTAMSESSDLVHWTEPSNLFIPDEAGDAPEIYTTAIFPYEDFYLALVHYYAHTESQTMWAELWFSRDLKNWKRMQRGGQFLPLGRVGEFDSHMSIFSGDPVRHGDELRFYYWGANSRHNDGKQITAVGLATLGLDRFVSLDSTDSRVLSQAVLTSMADPRRYEGETAAVLTRPFTFTGNRLVLNAETIGDGFVRAEIIDATTADPIERKHKGGFPVPGFALDQCDPVRGDKTAHTVTWNKNAGVGRLAGKPVRLRFVMRGCRLFTFHFAN